MPYSRPPAEEKVRGESSGSGRVLLNLRMGRAEVRDDLLMDYLLNRLSAELVEAVKLRAGMDPMVATRLDQLRLQLMTLSSSLSAVPDESLPSEWRDLLRQIGSNKP